jgi:hypothetical protein
MRDNNLFANDCEEAFDDFGNFGGGFPVLAVGTEVDVQLEE